MSEAVKVAREMCPQLFEKPLEIEVLAQQFSLPYRYRLTPVCRASKNHCQTNVLLALEGCHVPTAQTSGRIVQMRTVAPKFFS